jgi:hypothetical protein
VKRVVLHRKNALFYRTLHGAEAGDLFMSLIHTCELTGPNPLHYLLSCRSGASTQPLGVDAVELWCAPSASWRTIILDGRKVSTAARRKRHSEMAAKQASEKAKSHRVFGRALGNSHPRGPVCVLPHFRS